MPIADISPNFSGQIAQQEANMTQNGDAVEDYTRIWQLPVPNGWTGSPFDIVGIGLAFDRDDLNNAYSKAVDTALQPGGGRLADRIVSKGQVDYLAVMERSFRARHASPIRCAIHAAARRRGQGADGNVYAGVQDYLSTVLANGYVGDNTPPPATEIIPD